MTFVNRWDGTYFGWFDEGDLYTKDGRHVGRMKGQEIFASNGTYIGELRDRRLITNVSKSATKTWIGFIPARLRVLGPRVSPMNEEALNLPNGFEDFPLPEHL